MYSLGERWQTWMRDYTYGGLLFIPEGPIAKNADELRAIFDPAAAQISPAHLTITQPFLQAPTEADLNVIAAVLQQHAPFDLCIGPAVASPDESMIWLDVQPSEPILRLRDALHATKLFNITLPFSTGFIPHLTIAGVKSPLGPNTLPTPAIESIFKCIAEVNQKLVPSIVSFDHLVWSIPTDNFVFEVRKIFKL